MRSGAGSHLRRLGCRLAALLLVAACADPETGDADPILSEVAPPYPAGPTAMAVGATLPNLAFEGLSSEGERATLKLADYYRPGQPEPRLLVVQVSGGLWCGTCLWTASHFDEIVGPERLSQLDRLDLIVSDRDNAPASADDDAKAWADEVAADGVAVGVDPSFVLRAALEGVARPLPLVLLVDEGTMTLLDVVSDPTPGELASAIDRALSELSGEPAPEPASELLVDGLFDRKEWSLFAAMAEVPGAPPPDPTNEVADSPAARRLGEALFFDAGLSASGEVSCGSCHDPASSLSDDRPRAIGEGPGSRRTPSIALASHSRWQGWDGRADSLWAQALGPLESPLEHGASRILVARRVIERHARLYQAAFPDSPLPSPRGWPAQGKPGDAAFDALAEGEQHAITQVFVHVGKALAAYERTFRVRPTRFDAYMNGDSKALTSDEKVGMKAFATSGCIQCHFGPRLTNDAFHDTGVGDADAGRLEGLGLWMRSEFRGDGAWSAEPVSREAGTDGEAMRGRFKTPPLRGVAGRAFFNHAGQAASLEEVMDGYGQGQGEAWVVKVGETAQWSMVAFLEVMGER